MTTAEQREGYATRVISILAPAPRLALDESTSRLCDDMFDALAGQDSLAEYWGRTESLRLQVNQRPGRVTRVGEAWAGQSRLTALFESIRRAWVSEGVRDAFAALLSEAFGEVPEARVDELRWAEYDTQPSKGAGGPEILGAYVLSAGLLPPTVVDVPPTSSFGWREREAGPLAISYVAEFADLAALADMVAVWRADLLLVIQRWLSPAAYQYVDHGPPLACSPCGVIRMASPEVPRGPELGLQLDASSPFWALAA
ncbi:hypothetical protein OG625_40385 (plasmid) [Streptomyces sp. NBC_01351]|uniref:hypothetical protein n=1 Tax=Streptomyces sp. NBC_01351 TaxID=2903833 RepID=UPI002E364019|nr:hypothetical protein [Streptomyces sp. NBC_01351]